MRVLNEEEKPSLEEALKHYGVKGMRWGVRKSRGDRSAFKDRAKSAGQTTKKVVKRAGKRTAAAAAKAVAALEEYQAYKNRLRGEAFITDLFGVSSAPRRQLNALNDIEKTLVDVGMTAARQQATSVRVSAIREQRKQRS